MELVDCQPYRLQLSQPSCVAQWKSVVGKPMHSLNRLHHCLGCKVGAERAGVKHEPAPLNRFCCRCERVSDRLIGGRLCPSCYNREREYTLGVNARGTRPVKATPVYPLVIRVNQQTVQHTAASRTELVWWALRKDVHASIGWSGGFAIPKERETLFGGL